MPINKLRCDIHHLRLNALLVGITHNDFYVPRLPASLSSTQLFLFCVCFSQQQGGTDTERRTNHGNKSHVHRRAGRTRIRQRRRSATRATCPAEHGQHHAGNDQRRTTKMRGATHDALSVDTRTTNNIASSSQMHVLVLCRLSLVGRPLHEVEPCLERRTSTSRLKKRTLSKEGLGADSLHNSVINTRHKEKTRRASTHSTRSTAVCASSFIGADSSSCTIQIQAHFIPSGTKLAQEYLDRYFLHDARTPQIFFLHRPSTQPTHSGPQSKSVLCVQRVQRVGLLSLSISLALDPEGNLAPLLHCWISNPLLLSFF